MTGSGRPPAGSRSESGVTGERTRADPPRAADTLRAADTSRATDLRCPVGVILAGGQARRMGGRPKPLIPLAGKPLLQHVIDRLSPQVSGVKLSVERHDPALESFGSPQIPDPSIGSNGPLGGLLAALTDLSANNEWLLLAPCDAPFLPADLAVRLLEAAGGHPGAVVRYRGELQPTFSLWHRDLQPQVQRAVLHEGMGGFKQFLDVHPLPAVDWPASEPSPFFNVNTPEDLERAEELLGSEGKLVGSE